MQARVVHYEASDYWKNVMGEFDSTTMLDLYGQAYPEQKSHYDSLASEYDPDVAAGLLFKTLERPEEVGLGAPSPFETDVSKFPPLQKPAFPIPGKEKPKPFDVPAKLEDAVRQFPERWRRPVVDAYKSVMTSPKQARDLIEKGDWQTVTALANGGQFPGIDEVGTAWYLKKQGDFKKLDNTRAKSSMNLLDNALLNPQSSARRKAMFAGQLPDFELVSADWAIRNPGKAILPVLLGGVLNEVMKLPTTPEKWPEWVAYIAADRLLIAPAMKGFVASLQANGSILGMPARRGIGELFASKTPVTRQTLRDITGLPGTVADDLMDAWKAVPGPEKARMARMVQRGAKVHFVKPRFQKGMAGRIEMPVREHINFTTVSGQPDLSFGQASVFPSTQPDPLLLPAPPGTPAAQQAIRQVPPIPIRTKPLPPEAFEAGASRMAVRTGLPEEHIIMMRQIGATDIQIAQHARDMLDPFVVSGRAPAALAVGDAIGIPKWKTSGKIISEGAGELTVQLPTGVKVKVPKTDVVPESAISVPQGVEISGQPILKVEKAPLSNADVAAITDGLDEVGEGMIMEARKDPGITDEALADTLATTSKEPEVVRAIVKEQGATAVVDQVERAISLPAGEEALAAPVGEVIAPQPASELDTWRESMTSRLRAKIKQEDGFLRIRRDPPAESLITNEQIKAAARAGREPEDKAFSAAWVKDKATRMAQTLTGTFEPELKRAGELQFRDNFRTGALPIPSRAKNQTDWDFELIWGDRALAPVTEVLSTYTQTKRPVFTLETFKKRQMKMAKKRRQDVLDIIFLEDAVDTMNRGLGLPDNIHELTTTLPGGQVVPSVPYELQQLQSNASPAVLEAVENYKAYTQMIGRGKVARAKMPPEAVHDAYMPHVVLDYKPDWFESSPFIPRKLREPFEWYTKTRRGGPRRYSTDERTLKASFAIMQADDMFDDWAIGPKGVLPKYDIMPGLAEEKKLALFGQYKKPKPGKVYPASETGFPKDYMAVQYQPGRVHYSAYIADPNLLMKAIENMSTIDVDEMAKIFALPEEEQFDAIMNYLSDVGPRGGSALRIGKVIGQYRKTYLVPKAIGEKMQFFKDGPANIPGLFEVNRAVRRWKKFAIGPYGGGLPFQLRNLTTDAIAGTLHNSDFGRPRHLQNAGAVLKSFRPDLREDLTPFQQNMLIKAEEKDVIGSGLMFEINRAVHGVTTSQGFNQKYQRISGMREALFRLSMFSAELERIQKGMPPGVASFRHITDHLDPVSGAAFNAREFGGDYAAVPDYWRRYVTGGVFPFATWYAKMGRNTGWAIRHTPKEFVAKWVAPLVGTYAWNNLAMRDVEEALPAWQRQIPHLILPFGVKRDKKGKPIEAITVSVEHPINVLGQFMGLHTLPEKVTLVREGVLTPEEAAKWQLHDMGMGPAGFGKRLLSPFIRLMHDLPANKDSFKNRLIVPPELKGIPDYEKYRYWVPYTLESLIVPFSQFTKTIRDEDRLFSTIPEPAKMGDAFENYFKKGPGDFWRGLGIRRNDLRGAREKDMMLLMARSRGRYFQVLYEYENAFKNSDGDIEKFISSDKTAQVQERAQELGMADLRIPQLRRLLLSPRVQFELADRQLQFAKTAEEKEKLRDKKAKMRKFRALEGRMGLPEGILADYIKRLERLR